MKVHIRNPDRHVDVAGPRRVRDLLAELSIDPDTVLVIRDRALVTREQPLDDSDEVEIRPVISGGDAP
ncbi:MAG TPA: MoaD/ThiS family protein [Actinomycetota bacterium]|nr:MoaD/ThiS family protein [Actinomycetota bacterium]